MINEHCANEWPFLKMSVTCWRHSGRGLGRSEPVPGTCRISINQLTQTTEYRLVQERKE